MLTFSNALIIIIIFVVSSVVILFLASPLILFWIVNRNYIRKVEDDLTNRRYVAVVLTNKSRWDKIFIYLSGIMFLIMHLKKNKKSYKIMKEFDIKKFEEFIIDSNCYGLYIIGHGARHCLKIGNGKKEVLDYAQFKGVKNNKFVVQLHCNNGGGESLADIIASNSHLSYISDDYRYTLDNLLYFICLDPSFRISIFLASVIFELSILGGIIKLFSKISSLVSKNVCLK